MKISNEQINNFFNMLADLDSDSFQKLVDANLEDEALETIINHLEEFYQIEDDDELGMLAQIFIMGFLIDKVN